MSALLKGQTGDTEEAALKRAVPTRAAIKKAVEPNRVRAEFLRFLAIGGDEFAPVHEAGVELHNAFVDGRIDLRGAKCVKRLFLVNCFVDGALSIEGASLGLLHLEGIRVAGITAVIKQFIYKRTFFLTWGVTDDSMLA